MARLMLCPRSMTLVPTVGTRCAVLCAAVLALLSTFSTSARAQTAPEVTGIVGTVLRLEPGGSSADDPSAGNPHPGGVPANIINYSDCEANLGFQLTMSLSGASSNYDLVAWAGPDDCTVASARQSSTATCWPVTASPIAQNGPVDDAGAPTATVTLHMRGIVSQASAPVPVNASYSLAQSGACLAQTQTAHVPLALYFFFVDHVGVGNAVGIAQAYPIIVDTFAQNVGNGGFTITEQVDTQFTVAITAPVDPDTLVYNIYCDPPPGQETAVTLVPYDAATNKGQCVADSGHEATDGAGSDGTDGDADEDALASFDSSAAATSGLDDAGGNSCGAQLNDAAIPSGGTASCTGDGVLTSGGGTSGSTLVPATDDAGNQEYSADGGLLYEEAGVTVGGTMTLGIPSKYLCGTAPVSNPTLTITGLRDGYYYNIAVGAVDSAGNVGPLGVQCMECAQLADFWYNYTRAGGQAGGGYCATTEGVGTPAGMSGLGILAIASVIAVVRRRRRQ